MVRDRVVRDRVVRDRVVRDFMRADGYNFFRVCLTKHGRHSMLGET